MPWSPSVREPTASLPIMPDLPVTERTEVKRKGDRSAYDRDIIHSILDEALICHIGYVRDESPVVLPTIHARLDDTLYLHGSVTSNLLRTATSPGQDISVAASIVDGIVVARSVFNASMNYRSVVLFGHARRVEDVDEKLAGMKAVSDHVFPGRWEDVRLPNDVEMRQTLIAALPIDEGSAKIRSGPPVDEDEDYQLPYWAGVVPVTMEYGEAVPDPRLPPGVEVPAYLRPLCRPASATEPR